MSLSSSFPATRPELLLDFANGKAISSEISFRRESVATYFDKNGVLATAPVHEPRIDYDPVTLQPKGLLIEEARTNGITNGQFQGATNGVIGSGGVAPSGWFFVTPVGFTSEVIGSGSVNGLSYLDIRMSGTNTTGATQYPQFQSTGTTASSGQTWTSSLYLAMVGGSMAGIGYMDLQTIETNSGGYLTHSGTQISPNANLSRATHTRTLTQATANNVRTGVGTVILDGSSMDITLRVSACQIEQGAFPTSYIPTTSGAVTRAAETAFIPSLGRFFSPSRGSALCEMYYTTIATGAAANQWGHMMTFGPESGNAPRIDYYAQIQTTSANSNGMGNGVFKITNSAGVSQSDVAGQGGIVRDGLYKYAAGFSGTEMATYKNGSFFYSYPSVDLSGNSGYTRLTIGGLSSATGVSNHLNGHIRKIAYWPRRLTNAQLAALTR